jgi:hypothetical protein
MKNFIDFINEGIDSSRLLNDVKRPIYMEAKTKYMEEIADMLKAEGITVKKININGNIDDFASDSFTCYYNGETFDIDMSNRGVSLGLDAQRRDANWHRAVDTQYSTKVKTLVSKIKTNINSYK